MPALSICDPQTIRPMPAIRAGLPATDADHRSHPLAFIESAEPARRGRSVVPILLVAGWGGLFAYCATYLREDLPFRPSAPADMAARVEEAPRRPFVLPDVPGEPSHGDLPAPIQAEHAAPVLAAVQPATAVPPRAPAQGVPDYVGTWGPTPAACGSPSRRRGYLPATITADRAKAGRTLCAFRDGRRSGGAWVMAADCSDRGRRWSSQVRLLVDGDYLIWSSSRGTASYTRCGRRAG
jgi:hypothetical protein